MKCSTFSIRNLIYEIILFPIKTKIEMEEKTEQIINTFKNSIVTEVEDLFIDIVIFENAHENTITKK